MLVYCGDCKNFKESKKSEYIGVCKIHKEYGELEADESCNDYEGDRVIWVK